jgi:cell wall-associated NlpC family hydrolase
MKNYPKMFCFVGVLIFSLCTASIADTDLLSLFPIKHYNQAVSTWVNPADPDYDKPLLTAEMQETRYQDFFQHYFGAHSPWNGDYVSQLMEQTGLDKFKSIEQSVIESFNNQTKIDDEIGYGENFSAHTKEWIDNISKNINLGEWNALNYNPENRAIAINNTYARALPTPDPYFYSPKIAGEGYPFDMLQMSAVWVGTPLYIIKESADHAWSLVLTPEYVAWVKSDQIARTSGSFVKEWEAAAKDDIAAITRSPTSILDNDNQFLFSAFVGAVFPVKEVGTRIQIYVPVTNQYRQAEIKSSSVSTDDIAVMPLAATPHHFADLMGAQIGRPYGWGNLYFYNDCSAELKSLYTPFGIWLPRNSSQQVTAGKQVDMSNATLTQRLSYLMKDGKKFMTIVYLGGHIVMYLGSTINPNSRQHELMVMTYQNLWGLMPYPPTRRSVIGKATLFPLLPQYPEDKTLVPQAARQYFQVSYLDVMPDPTQLPATSLSSLMTGTP